MTSEKGERRGAGMVKRTPRVGASRFRKRKPCSFETASAYEAAIHDSIRQNPYALSASAIFEPRGKSPRLQKPTVNSSESPRARSKPHTSSRREVWPRANVGKMSLAFDEFGRPFIIIKVRRRPVAAHPGSARTATPRRDLASVPTASRSPASPRFRSPLRPLSSRQQEQGNKSRIRGIEAQKANIQAAKSVARTLRSSLGPKVRRAGPTDLAWERRATNTDCELRRGGKSPPRLVFSSANERRSTTRLMTHAN